MNIPWVKNCYNLSNFIHCFNLMTLASQGKINLDFLRKKGDQPITVKALPKSNWEVNHGISHH